MTSLEPFWDNQGVLVHIEYGKNSQFIWGGDANDHLL